MLENQKMQNEMLNPYFYFHVCLEKSIPHGSVKQKICVTLV
jgi:hypothetical protein